MRQYPKPQEIYRHFKGNCYQIITLARNKETGEKMVVYQQLHTPYEVYVRPLEIFMSKVDIKKYPKESQIYRFEKLNLRGEYLEQSMEDEAPKVHLSKDMQQESDAQEQSEGDVKLDPGLLAFLDADSYERKLEILSALHPVITNEMIDTMAASLDTEIKDGDVEQRYNEIKSCLITMERFECNRLR